MTQAAADPDRLYWDEHVREGIEARQQRDGAQWRLGDLAASVETTYGEQSLQKYAEEIGVEFNTLREYRRVANEFGNATRVANLSWTHHREVAALDDPEPWLRMAAHEGWSVARLRQEIEATRREAYEATSQAIRHDVREGGYSGRPAEREYARRMDREHGTTLHQAAQEAVEYSEALREEAEWRREVAPVLEAAGFSTEEMSARVARTFPLFNALEAIAGLPDPAAIASEIPEYQEYRIEAVPGAIDWLQRFMAAWRARG